MGNNNRVWIEDAPEADVVDRVLHFSAAGTVVLVPSLSRAAASTWVRPPRDVIKLKFDASLPDHGPAGLGLFVRNDGGLPMAAATAVVDRHLSPHRLWRFLHSGGRSIWRLDLCFHRVQFETDCYKVYECWKKRPSDPSYFHLVMQDCYALASAFD